MCLQYKHNGVTTLGWCYLSCISTLECQLIDLQGSVNHTADPAPLPPHCEPWRGHHPVQMWLCLQLAEQTNSVCWQQLSERCLLETDLIIVTQDILWTASQPFLTHNWHQTHHSIEGPAPTRVCSLFLVTVRLCVAIPKNLTKSRSENTKKYKISENHQRFDQLMSCCYSDLIQEIQ